MKASDLRRRWDNLMVCDKCYEPRHPQDFIRAIPDMQRVPFVRPEASDTFVSTGFATASITSPLTGATVTGSVDIDVSVSTLAALRTIKFYVDSILTSTYTVSYSPSASLTSFFGYIYTLDTTLLSDTSHTLYIIATDNAGSTTQSSSINITTSNVVAGTVTIDYPSEGFLLGPGTLNLDFTVAGGPGVNYVRAYFNGDLIGTYDNTLLGTTDFSDTLLGDVNMSIYNDCTNHTLELIVEDINADVSVTASIQGKVCF